MVSDTAPKGLRIQPPSKDKAPRQPSGRKKNLSKPLTEFFMSIGGVVYAFNQVDGQAIMSGAENLANALNEAAKANPALYRNLERLMTGSTYGAVFIAAGAIALPIMANHNLIPFAIPGLTPEETPASVEDTPPSQSSNEPPISSL